MTVEALQSKWPRGRAAAGFLGVMFFGYLAFAADRTVLSAMLKPLSASLGLNGVYLLGVTETGWLVAAQFIGVLSLVLVSGLLSDRYGQRSVVLAGVLVFTSTTWLIGLSSTFAEAFVMRLLSGVGEGLFWPAAMSAVAGYFGGSKGAALGIFYAGFDLGGAAGNSIGSAAFAFTGDWRTAFFVAPVLGVPVIAGVIASKKGFGRTRNRAAPDPGEMGELLRDKRVVALLAFAFLATWASIWQVAYLPYYYSEVLGASVPAAGLIAAAVLVSGMAGKLVFGKASDSTRRSVLLVAVSVMAASMYAVFFYSPDFAVGIAAVMATGFFSGSIFPMMQALASDLAQGKVGTVLGMTTTFQSGAAVVGTLLPGALFSLGAGSSLALDAMVPAILMAGAAFFLRDPRGVLSS
jgi:MFS transporter, ACS family, hexuronate transporter